MIEENNNPQNDNNENKEQNEINREATTTGVVQEVPSKKFIFGEKVITLTKKKDISAVVGEELSNGEIKERLITAIKENGERQKEKEDEQEKETGEKPKKSFIAKYIVPIIIFLMIPIMLLRGCSGKQQETTPKEELVTIPIELKLDDIDNPYKILEGLINSSGQESMTANAIEGEGLEGTYYSSIEQFEAEYRASSGAEHFEEMKAEIDSTIDILTSEDSSKEEKANAARRLLELEQEATDAYINNEDFAKEYAERFKKASEAHKDTNTDSEKVAIDLMLEEYLSELGLSSYNVAQLEEIVELVNDGYEIDVEAEKEMDGDYEITGEAVKKVVQEQDLNKSKSMWQKFVDFVKGRDDKGIEK